MRTFKDLVNIPLDLDDKPLELAKQIIENRHDIIDLFCGTFLAIQDAPSIEDLRDLFDLIELECKMEGLNETYRIKLREVKE